MSFSNTKVADLNTGDLVVITATKAEMLTANGYRANFDQGTVAKVAELGISKIDGAHGKMHFKLEGNTGGGGWLQTNYVKKVEGVVWDDLNLSEGDVVMPLDDGCDITAHSRYDIYFNEDEDCLGFDDDAGDFREDPSDLWVNITKVSASAKAPEGPKMFHELTDAEKGELLLAKHEGSVIQFVGIWNNWTTVVEDSTFRFADNGKYRLLPARIAELEKERDETADRFRKLNDELRDLNKTA